MNGVDDVFNPFFYFGKLLAENRQGGTFGIEFCNQRVGKSVKKNVIKDEFLNKKYYDFLIPFLLNRFLLARSAIACASAFVIAVDLHRVARSAFTRNQTLTVTAEQFGCQQIFVLNFVLSGRFLVSSGSFLYLFEQLDRDDGGNAVRNDYFTILIFSDISAVVQHSRYGVKCDLRSSDASNTFDVEVVRNLLHVAPLAYFLNASRTADEAIESIWKN